MFLQWPLEWNNYAIPDTYLLNVLLYESITMPFFWIKPYINPINKHQSTNTNLNAKQTSINKGCWNASCDSSELAACLRQNRLFPLLPSSSLEWMSVPLLLCSSTTHEHRRSVSRNLQFLMRMCSLIPLIHTPSGLFLFKYLLCGFSSPCT